MEYKIYHSRISNNYRENWKSLPGTFATLESAESKLQKTIKADKSKNRGETIYKIQCTEAKLLKRFYDMNMKSVDFDNGRNYGNAFTGVP